MQRMHENGQVPEAVWAVAMHRTPPPLVRMPGIIWLVPPLALEQWPATTCNLQQPQNSRLQACTTWRKAKSSLLHIWCREGYALRSAQNSAGIPARARRWKRNSISLKGQSDQNSMERVRHIVDSRLHRRTASPAYAVDVVMVTPGIMPLA